MKEITVKAELGQILNVTEFIDDKLGKLDCPVKARLQIDVAIDEIVSNIVNYSYEGESGKVTVCFDYMEKERMAVITFIDNGIAYNPLLRDEPDVEQLAHSEELGGVGIFIVKKTMDDVTYSYLDGKNILKIFKKI